MNRRKTTQPGETMRAGTFYTGAPLFFTGGPPFFCGAAIFFGLIGAKNLVYAYKRKKKWTRGDGVACEV